jgi:hypothetical protein
MKKLDKEDNVKWVDISRDKIALTKAGDGRHECNC